MRPGVWLRRVGDWRVEHVPYDYLTGQVDLDAPPKGLLHTTQGSTIEGALSVFRVHYAPNFTLGPDARKRVRVLQHAPLGTMGQALANKSGGVETNRVVRAQIELVGFSQFQAKWLPEGETLRALIALMDEVGQACNIPLAHVTVDRDPAKWAKATGWVGHRDCPENDHVDPGSFDYRKAFDLIRARPGGQDPAARSRPRVSDRVRTAPLKRRAKKAPPTSCHVSDLGARG